MASGLKDRIRDGLRAALKSVRKFAYAHPIRGQQIDSAHGARRPRLGLAFGGGFARGLAHIGVLKVLLDNHVPIDAVAGSSVGSIVAAAYASGCTIEEMLEGARATRWKDFARWTIPRMGFATNLRMEEMLRRLLRCSRFEDVAVPLAIVAADVSSGQAVVFREGDLIPPLRASCSFPGLFVPVQYQGHLLVDGAIVGSVPVEPLRQMGADKVVAVFLKNSDRHHTPTNLFQVVDQAFHIAASLGQASWRSGCDLIIEPDVGEFRWDDFGRADELIRAGERAAREALPALRRLMGAEPALAVAGAVAAPR